MGFFPAEAQQGTMLGPLLFNGRYNKVLLLFQYADYALWNITLTNKLLVNAKLQLLDQQIYFLSIVWTVTNNKNELWKTVRLTTFHNIQFSVTISIRLIRACFCICCVIRATFVWPWNEKVQTKQKKQTNGNRAILLPLERIQTRVAFGLLRERSGLKTSCPRAF